MIFLQYIIAVFIVLIAVQNMMYRTTIAQYKKYIEEVRIYNQQNDTVLIYCLQRILLDSLSTEDYETAAHCRNLLSTLQKEQNTPV